METIFVHEIYSKLKTKEDIINYFRENGNQIIKFIIYIRIILPQF